MKSPYIHIKLPFYHRLQFYFYAYEYIIHSSMSKYGNPLMGFSGQKIRNFNITEFYVGVSILSSVLNITEKGTIIYLQPNTDTCIRLIMFYKMKTDRTDSQNTAD